MNEDVGRAADGRESTPQCQGGVGEGREGESKHSTKAIEPPSRHPMAPPSSPQRGVRDQHDKQANEPQRHPPGSTERAPAPTAHRVAPPIVAAVQHA